MKSQTSPNLFIAIVGTLAAVLSVPAHASHDSECSASLTSQWRDQVAAHPVDPSRNVFVLSIDTPLRSTDEAGAENYERTIARLKQAFPSFEEGWGSGFLTGCCAMPVWGSISPDELARLSNARFAPLCAIARRSRSSSAGIRVEYREAYERRQGADAYFSTYWHDR